MKFLQTFYASFHCSSLVTILSIAVKSASPKHFSVASTVSHLATMPTATTLIAAPRSDSVLHLPGEPPRHGHRLRALRRPQRQQVRLGQLQVRLELDDVEERGGLLGGHGPRARQRARRPREEQRLKGTFW